MEAARNDTIVVANEVNWKRNSEGRSMSKSRNYGVNCDNLIPGRIGFAMESEGRRYISDHGLASRPYQTPTSHTKALTLDLVTNMRHSKRILQTLTDASQSWLWAYLVNIAHDSQHVVQQNVAYIGPMKSDEGRHKMHIARSTKCRQLFNSFGRL